MSEQQRESGTVIKWISAKRFGFIKAANTGVTSFFHQMDGEGRSGT
jgi:'Cold-shock' DNA-binding domain